MRLLQPGTIAVLATTFVMTACSNGASDQTPATDNATVSATNDAANAAQQTLDENKKLVTDFYQGLYGDKDSTAIDKYIADDIREHNPLLQDGKEWLKNELRPFLTNPNIQKTKIEIAQMAAEGDMVWMLVKDVAPNGKVFARVNIFRVANGKITEAWKVAEQVPEKSANQNTPF